MKKRLLALLSAIVLMGSVSLAENTEESAETPATGRQRRLGKPGGRHHRKTCVSGSASIPTARTGQCRIIPCCMQGSRFIVSFPITNIRKISGKDE